MQFMHVSWHQTSPNPSIAHSGTKRKFPNARPTEDFLSFAGMKIRGGYLTLLTGNKGRRDVVDDAR